MKFVITVNVDTVESETRSGPPLSTILAMSLPMILSALGVNPPPVPESDDSNSEPEQEPKSPT